MDHQVADTLTEAKAGEAASPRPGAEPLALLRGWWREGRLQLAGLPDSVRIAVWALIAVVAATVALLLALALGTAMPGGAVRVPSAATGLVDELGLALIVLLWIALAVIAAASLLLASLEHARRPRLVLLVVGLVTLVYMAGLVAVGDDLHNFERLGLADGGLAGWRVLHAVGWAGVAAALVTMVVPLSVLRAHAAVPLVLGGGPYVGGLLVTALGDGAHYRLGELVPAWGDLTAREFAARPFLDASYLLSVALVLTLYWQGATWARAGRRDFGLLVSSAVRRWLPLLALLLGVKVLFIGIGYAGIGACASRAEMSPWTLSACDGAVSWAVAAGLAALVMLWLVRPTRLAISERYLVPVALLVVVGFSFTYIAIVAASVPGAIMALVEVRPATGAVAFPACVDGAAAGGLYGLITCGLAAASFLAQTQLAPLGTVALLLAGGTVLAVRPRWRMLGVTMLVFGVWAAPRALDALLATLAIDPGQSFGVELVTFDTVLTIGLVLVTIVAWRATDLRLAAAVALVLVVSTLAAHGSTLLPAAGRILLGYLLLAAPLAYLILLDSKGLNEPGPDRPARVLGAFAGATALLVMAATAVSVDSVDLSADGLLPTLLFLVPFAAILVGASVTQMHQQPALGPPEPAASADRAAQPESAS